MEFFNYIEEKLSILATRIELRGRLNILDLHLHSENFYMYFFNMLFGWNLENLNAIDQNAPGVDLIDKSKRIIVQVSATATRQKIESALERVPSEYNNYSFKFISISKAASRLRNLEYLNPQKLKFSPAEDIYDFCTLLALINEMETGQMKEVCDFLREELDEATPGRTMNLRKPFQVYPLPDNYVVRSKPMADIKKKLLCDTNSRSGVLIVNVIHGMGGIGKSILAEAIAMDDEVQRHFSDGVLWVTLGQKPDLLSSLNSWIRELDDSYSQITSIIDVENASRRLCCLLNNKEVLLIVDDAWDVDHVNYFRAGGGGCRMLVTTRDATIAEALRVSRYEIDEMTESEALELLSNGVDLPLEGTVRDDAAKVARAVGYLPLAIELAAAQIAKYKITWIELLNQLEEGINRLNYPGSQRVKVDKRLSLKVSMQLSIKRLAPEEGKCFAWLGITYKSAMLTPAMAATLWDMNEAQAAITLSDFFDLALLRRFTDTGVHAYRLHDVLRDEARCLLTAPTKPKQAIDVLGLGWDICKAHAEFIKRYQEQPNQDRCHSVSDDGYYYQYLPYHMKESGMLAELRLLLLQFDWLYWKLIRTNILSLLGDYDLYLRKCPNDWALELIRGAIRISSHILSKDKHQLASQLIGRLLAFEKDEGNEYEEIRSFLNNVKVGMDSLVSSGECQYSAWFCPLNHCFESPMGPLIMTLVGHESWVTAVTITPDGTKAVSASYDHMLKIWDLSSGEDIGTLKGDSEWINTIAITPDSRKAVLGTGDKKLKIWDLSSRQEIVTIPTGHEGEIRAIAITPDGKNAVSASDDATIKIWDLERREEIRTLKRDAVECNIVSNSDARKSSPGELPQDKGIKVLAITSDNKKAVSGTGDGALQIWDLENGEEIEILERDAVEGDIVSNSKARKSSPGELPQDKGIKVIAIASKSKKAVSGAGDGTLQILDLDSREIMSTKGHTHAVLGVAVTPDGKIAVSASSDTTLKIWDLSNGEEIGILKGHEQSVLGVAITPDNMKAVSVSDDKKLKIWDLCSGKEIRSLTGHIYSINAVAITSDGKKAVSASKDTTLKIWDLDNTEEIRIFKGHTHPVHAVAKTSDGMKAVSASSDTTLKIWDLRSGEEISTLKGHTRPVRAVEITRDGKRALSVSEDHNLRIWNIKSGKEIRTITGQNAYVNAIAISHDGKKVVLASKDAVLKILNLRSAREIGNLTGHIYQVNALMITPVIPNGEKVVSASDDGTIIIWDLESKNKIRTLRGHDCPVYSVAIDGKSEKAVSGSGKGTIKIWDLYNGREIRTLTGHIDSVTSIAITPDGKKVVSASSDKTIILWNLNNGKIETKYFADDQLIFTMINDSEILTFGTNSGVMGILSLRSNLKNIMTGE